MSDWPIFFPPLERSEICVPIVHQDGRLSIVLASFVLSRNTGATRTFNLEMEMINVKWIINWIKESLNL